MARRQRRDLLVFESSCQLSTALGGGFTLSLLIMNVEQESSEYQFLGNQTRVYCFSSRHSIHSTTDRYDFFTLHWSWVSLISESICQLSVTHVGSVEGPPGCFIISPLSNFLTATLFPDGIFDADHEFDIIFLL